MKKIVIVAASEESTKGMLKKTLRFAPEVIQVVYFESSNSSAASIQSTIQHVTKGRCEAEMVISSGITSNEKAEALSRIVTQIKPDMVVIHRPHIGQDERDYSLIKSVLKTISSSTIFLCGDQLWKSKIKAVATLDIVNESSVQKILNGRVIDVAIGVSDAMQAELTFLSVLAISKISSELDIANPSEVMANKGQATKAKLEKTIQDKSASLTFSTHVSAGIPSDEISSVSQKLKSNLVIVGNVGRTGIKGLIMGNTAEKILNLLAVDALIVK